jgi:putative iron-regulated protein
LAGATGLAAGLLMSAPAFAADADGKAILNNYADIALAGYEDSLTTAKALDVSIDALIAKPSEETLEAAKKTWLASRVPYQQTEAYRFGNAVVDDWEGKVNAWPLDEGLIDYVKSDYYGTVSDENMLFTANVIANKSLKVGGKDIDTSNITPELLGETLHEADGIEANVATGYHAIEFLLWGQDVNGNGKGAGTRPATDYDTANCTGGNCDRRAAYLKATSQLMIKDLEEIAAAWGEGGTARKTVMDGSTKEGFTRMLTGMGSLSYGELAGERMKLGLLLHDPEEEHDCFSDNTHNSHFYDAIGIENVYFGRYTRIDGSVVEGPSLSALVKAKDGALDAELAAKLKATNNAMMVMKKRAEDGEAYDQMIGEGNADGNAVVQTAIDALVDQTKSIERIVVKLDLGKFDFEGSDSLDNPNAVFQ